MLTYNSQCGDHHHELSLLDPNKLLEADHVGFTKHEWTCRGCGDDLPTVAMHLLPCGHSLCRLCLEDVVLVHATRSIRNGGALIRACIVQAHAWHDRAIALQHSADANDSEKSNKKYEKQASEALKTAHDAWNEALELAGQTCCGVDMELGQWVGCMEPRTARLYFVVREALAAREWWRCGWPDCGELIGPRCAWMAREEDPRWYCVRCGGNSQQDRDSGGWRRPQYLVQAR